MGDQKITVLGQTFNSDEERREYFRKELRKKLPQLKQMEGFPLGADEDIINLSDPPFYTACPNPWVQNFIDEWEKGKKHLLDKGDRISDFIVSEPYASDVSEGKNNPIYKSHTYHTKVPHPAIMRYILHYTQPGDIIYDGFAGTGMTGVAADECKNESFENKAKFTNQDYVSFGKRFAICTDLSPLASFIAYNLNATSSLESIERFNEVLSRTSKKYGHLFKTKHSNGKDGDINYVIWSDIISCPSCENEETFWNLFVELGMGGIKSECECQNCTYSISRKKMTPVMETYYDSILQEPISRKKREPVLISYSYQGKKYTKSPDQLDKDTIALAEMEIKKVRIPTFRMPEGDESRRNDKYGITHTHQFYSLRNLIIIHEIFSQLELSEKWFVTNSISRNLTLLNRFVVNKHNPLGRINGPMSGTLYIPSESVEQNPFVLLEYKSKLATYKDRLNVISTSSATNQNSIKDNSIDYIFIDPPFGANIMYSELNFLSESWLRIMTNNEPEAIENKSQQKTKFEYQSLMMKALKENYRILKPGKWMTVEFSNTSAAIWNSIQTSLTQAGFVIANVSSIDKKHGGFRAMTYPGSVKQDLVISCYKPSKDFDISFSQHEMDEDGVWSFVHEHLNHLPVHLKRGNSTTAIIEREPKILFDRLIAFYVQRNLPVPIDLANFRKGLIEKFYERDGMFFTDDQIPVYDRKKEQNPDFIQLSILVSSEQEGILWLKNFLNKNTAKYQDIQPEWMKALGGVRNGDEVPELSVILQENFLEDEQGRWYVPDPENEADLEKLRTKRLLKQFDEYLTIASKPKGKLKEVRVESLRAGFKDCYQQKDFKSIVQVGDRIPNNLLMEDEVLLQFYDIACSRV